MVFSYYLLKIPYCLIWNWKKLTGTLAEPVFYCADVLDWQIFAPVQKYLPQLQIVAKNKKTQQALKELGLEAKKGLFFPEAVIMCRHDTWRYPCEGIIKIGMRHGAYHFKKFTSAKNYNQFHMFFMTSATEVSEAEAVGIKNAYGIGFPKLDPAFNGEITKNMLNKLRREMGFSTDKPTLLFTATWDESGMSAVHLWYDRLSSLSEEYNVMVTLHPWVKEEFKKTIKNTTGVYYINETNVLPFIMLADICLGDTSSILAECCALDKPLITFSLPPKGRTVPEIITMLQEISTRINSFQEVRSAISECLKNPHALHAQRMAANKRMFDVLDGKAGQRAAAHIKTLLFKD